MEQYPQKEQGVGVGSTNVIWKHRRISLASEECLRHLKAVLEASSSSTTTSENHSAASLPWSGTIAPTGTTILPRFVGDNDNDSSSSFDDDDHDNNDGENAGDKSQEESDDDGDSTDSKSSSEYLAESPNVRNNYIDSQEPDPSIIVTVPSAESTTRQPKPSKPLKKDEKQRQREIQRLVQSLHCAPLPLPAALLEQPDNNNNNKNAHQRHQQRWVLDVPLALLSKTEKQEYDAILASDNSDRSIQNASLHAFAARCFFDLATELVRNHRPVVILLVRSGRFAGAVFGVAKQPQRQQPQPSGMVTTCLVHRTSQRYTIRAGQGKAQSAQDNSSRRPMSMGAQLRRAGEEQLKQDIVQTLHDWQSYVETSALILISCPKTMQHTLFGTNDTNSDHKTAAAWLRRKDARIRRIPLDVGRPTFEAVQLIHDALLSVTVRPVQQPDTGHAHGTAAGSEYHREHLPPQSAFLSTTSDKHTNAQRPAQEMEETTNKVEEEEVENLPWTDLHLAARQGNLELLVKCLEEHPDQVDCLGGELLQTALHVAAEAATATTALAARETAKGDDTGNDKDNADDDEGDGNENGNNTHAARCAPDCVYHLLVTGHANPTICDIRNRPPYFLATSEKVRIAFRKARAELGEDYCDWNQAKVGPPLTDDIVEQKKEKEAEKKRQKRARQKEKKAQEKAAAAAAEKQLREEEEKRKQEEDAKRIRDGLQPKSGGSNVCDFCQQVCKGKKRSQMFQRLDYVYCSTECVQKHKRELMASAALARFGG